MNDERSQFSIMNDIVNDKGRNEPFLLHEQAEGTDLLVIKTKAHSYICFLCFLFLKISSEVFNVLIRFE